MLSEVSHSALFHLLTPTFLSRTHLLFVVYKKIRYCTGMSPCLPLLSVMGGHKATIKPLFAVHDIPRCRGISTLEIWGVWHTNLCNAWWRLSSYALHWVGNQPALIRLHHDYLHTYLSVMILAGYRDIVLRNLASMQPGTRSSSVTCGVHCLW